MNITFLKLFAAGLAAGLIPQGAVLAQSAGCAISRDGGARQTLSCPGGVKVTAEAGASFQLSDRNRDGSPDSLSLRSKAALVDVDSSQHRGGFQVVTPQAIAAVRGTQWAVDVKGGTTSVLVTRGRVGVRRPAGAAVVLGPGEGVDVMRGTAALTVRTWPAPRVAALLSRLGQ